MRGEDECPENDILLYTCSDHGLTWTPVLVIDPCMDAPVIAHDPCLWHDPNGVLRLKWWQDDYFVQNNEVCRNEYRQTCWPHTSNPEASHPEWSEPEELFQGISINKPVVLSNGKWLDLSVHWHMDYGIRVYQSSDQGRTWQLQGCVNVPRCDRNCDEPELIERRDGSLCGCW